MEENDKEAAESQGRPALVISDLATRFSQHLAAGRHGVEWIFCDNEWPAILKFHEALRKHLFQRDGGASAAIRKLWSNTPLKVNSNFSQQLFRTGGMSVGLRAGATLLLRDASLLG